MPHFTPSGFLDHQVGIVLAGCGGNGSQMLTGLARLNHALVALGHPGLHVTAYDDDVVSEANIGRQLFSRADVGQSKAAVLMSRVNHFFGTTWKSEPVRFEGNVEPELLVLCVDSAAARRLIYEDYQSDWHHSYVLDVGNRAADGQAIFGEWGGQNRQPKKSPAGHVPLPDPYQLLPELIDITVPEDDTPSCGLAEALERQELFINQAVVTPALAILWEFFRYGQLSWHGAFVNLRTGSSRPLLVKESQ
ncbi:PRTRC system ThiF family protein [Collimonas sp. H4R21]|uniref:PRTRC system ThiF family protein n=1 Tax=Collimonas rhizosphaerae TaxID=3126357 RepID=A0ABU9PXT6_9BURK